MNRKTLGRNNIGQISSNGRIDEIDKYIDNMLKNYFKTFNDIDLIELEFLVHNKIGWIRSQVMMDEANSCSGDEK